LEEQLATGEKSEWELQETGKRCTSLAVGSSLFGFSSNSQIGETFPGASVTLLSGQLTVQPVGLSTMRPMHALIPGDPTPKQGEPGSPAPANSSFFQLQTLWSRNHDILHSDIHALTACSSLSLQHLSAQ